MTQLPIPIHVGSEPPGWWRDIEARQREFGDEASPWLQKKRRPTVASATLDWGTLGFEPRWVRFDTADCVAALQPSIFSGQGADEFNRFRQGAESRGELALVISPVGQLDGGDARSVFSPHDDSVYLDRVESSISSRPLGLGAIFEAWREEDAEAVRRSLFGDVDPLAVESTLPTEDCESVGRRRGWFRRR